MKTDLEASCRMAPSTRALHLARLVPLSAWKRNPLKAEGNVPVTVRVRVRFGRLGCLEMCFSANFLIWVALTHIPCGHYQPPSENQNYGLKGSLKGRLKGSTDDDDVTLHAV